MYQFSLKKPTWQLRLTKGLAVIAAITMVFNMSALGVLIAPKTAEAKVTVCPAGNVKLNIGTGYEYNDGSATITGTGSQVSWAATAGFEIIDVCVKAGTTLYHPDPSATPYSKPGSSDISHVVVYTDPAPTTNPPLGKACGLDIGLIIDSSGSIDNTELNQMKTAFNGFVDAFLPGTPTEMSVNEFDTNVVGTTLAFTDVIANIKARINAATSGGFTNWEAALSDMHNQYDPRTAKPDLIVFASDGNPNTVGVNGNSSGGSASEATAVAAAVARANAIKADGIRIIALGIGNDLNVDNLKAVSGTNVATTAAQISTTSDVITADFSTLATTLSALAGELCGGKILVQKQIDTDGNGTPEIDGSTPNAALTGWTFDVNGTPSDPVAQVTTNTGYLEFEVENGTYSVTETSKSGYSITDAYCKLGGQTVGTHAAGSNTISGIPMGTEQTISCTFVNHPTACKLEITKSVNKTNAAPGDVLTYTLNYKNTGDAKCTGTGARIDDVIPTGVTYNGTHTQSVTTGTDTDGLGIHFGYTGTKFSGFDNASGYNGTAVSWNAHEIAPNESGTVTFQATVNSIDYCTETDITNKGKIYADQITSGVWSNEVSTHVTALCEGKLKVKKYVDVGGLTPDSWSFTVGSTTLKPSAGTNYVIFDLPAGTYTATESTVAGYHQVSSTCTNVTVVPNQTTICEFHNAQDLGQLTVIKHVVGSQEPASSWTMKISTPVAQIDSFAGNEAGTTKTYPAGTYRVTEQGPIGYTLTYSGDCDANGNVTLAHGEHKTCTLTNTRDTGTIKVIKNVDTDGDGDIDVAGATDWTWDISGGEQNIATGTTKTVNTGIYTINEDQKTNYHVVSLVCGTQNLGATQSTQLTVTKGQNIVCTFTNARDTGDLRIKKYEDTNGNGQKDANEPYITGWEFTVSQNGQTVATGTTNAQDSNWLLINDLPTGTYDVTETPQNGWINTEPGVAPITKQVTITKDNLTSVWFGNFHLGKISGYKWNDVNEDGQYTNGTDQALSGWTIKLWKNGSVVDTKITDANGYYEFAGLTYGTYDVTENMLPGWFAVTPNYLTGHTNINIISGSDIKNLDFFNFEYGEISGYKWNDLDGNGTWENGEPGIEGWTINLWKNGQPYATDQTDANGYYEFDSLQSGSYAVTEDESNTAWVRTSSPAGFGPFNVESGSEFANNNFGNFKTPTLTVVKHVINDNGGNAVASDFTMQVTGTNVSTPSFAGNESGTTVTLGAGSYSVDEIEIDGYAKSIGANCSGTVQSGSEVTCTITNDDEAASITLIKEVVNNNGGTAGVNDFGLTIGGTSVTSGQTLSVEANKAYALNEAGLSGYSFVSLTGNEACPSVLGGTVTLNEGEDITCTITNDDIAPKLKLVKSVTNNDGGTLEVSDFPLFIDQTQVTSGQWNTVTANTQYTLSETNQNGYEASDWTGDCAANGTITLNVGDQKTCYITNDDIAGRIDGYKFDEHEDGLEGWEICLDDQQCTYTDEYGYFEFTGVAAGTHTVSETMQNGWQPVDPLSAEYDDVLVTLDNTTRVNFMNKLNEFDVSIEKSGPETVEAGNEMTYTLDWTVTGNTTVYNATINDAIPADTTFVSASNGGTHDSNTNTVTWDLGSPLTPDQSGQVTLTVKVNSPLTNETEIENSAQICAAGDILQNDYYSSLEDTISVRDQMPIKCDDDDTTTTVHSAPILALEKSNDKEDVSVVPTETINYTIVWSVDGNSHATNVTLVDTIPTEITIDVASISNSGTWDGATRTITWDLGTQVPHAEGFVTYSATVNSPAVDGTVIHNVAKLSSDETDPEFYEDDSDTVIKSLPVMVIEKSVDLGNDLGFVNPGDTVTYTVVVTNTGTDTLKNVKLSDTLPDGFLFLDTLTPTHEFSLGDIAAGNSVTTTYEVIVGADVVAGNYDNLAVATADNHTPVDDTATVEVRVPTPLPDETKPILSIDKTVNVQFANPGDTIEYTVVLKNTGDAQALNVTLTDTLPTGFTFEDGKSTKTWNVGSIDVNGSWTITYKVKIAKTVTAGEYENLAMAKASNHDPVQDRAQVEVRIPKVLGDSVPDTGAGIKDYAIFIASFLMIIAGALFIHEGRKRAQVANKNS